MAKTLPAGTDLAPGTRDQASGGMQGYWVTIFLGAFLLFSIQLLLGKYFLPWFGGTPAMWTTCMFFFQVLLLAGYAYAHALANRFPPRAQAIVHCLLLAAGLGLLAFLAVIWGSPVTPSLSWRPHGNERPVWNLIVLLTVSAGLPYFLLATTGPLLQSWFTRTHPGRSPYRLYALSNFGSLLGLVSYPFLIEPWISLRHQALLWALGFIVYVVLCGYCALKVRNAVSYPVQTAAGAGSGLSQTAPSLRTRLLWLALAACASVMFLATTNQICQDIAVVPFLWVLPLSLYLLSFIICFERSRWYSRSIFHPALAVAIFLACFVLGSWGIKNILLQVTVYSFVLVVVCMVCHGELARSRPGARYLTSFYLMIALGGALGGTLVALIFPDLFRGFWEYHLGLWSAAALLFVVLGRDKSSWLYSSRYGLAAIAIAAAALPGSVSYVTSGGRGLGNLFPVIPVLIGVYFLVRGSRKGHDPARAKAVPIYCVASLLVLGGVLFFNARNQIRNALESTRNFYGVLTVRELAADEPSIRAYTLFHGRIAHGFQFRSEARHKLPTGYYAVTSGAGLALTALQVATAAGGTPQSLRLGVIGLGAGTLAAYGKPGDYVRFYEINPDITRIARGPYFTYLSDCQARLDVIAGDARLSMENELERDQPQQFDLLAIDAFSGDAIPVHLLTEEAFQIYLREMKTEGIIAVHITNNYFDLRPVLKRVAERFGLHYRLAHTDGDNLVTTYSDWVLLSHDDKILNSLPPSSEGLRSRALRENLHLWTDDYSNLLWVLRR
jgi:spermidine synthase